MRFGEVPLEQAAGGLLAHGLVLAGRRVGKGTVVTPELLAAARAAGLATLWIARLQPGDVGEEEAARRLGAALAGPGVEARAPVHGRVHLHARQAGLLLVEQVAQANAAAEEIGIATMPPFSPVEGGALLATAKIIPFALPEARLAAALAVGPRLEVRVWRPGLEATILVTRLPGRAGDKAESKSVEVTAARLARLGIGSRVMAGIPHATAPLCEALQRAAGALLLIAGATATADAADVIPAAILAAGGQVIRVGMPVDPGNLLVLGRIGESSVIGLPGCAKSPRRNGLDLVLERIAAGLEPTSQEIAGLGVGGLLEGSGAAVPWGWA